VSTGYDQIIADRLRGIVASVLEIAAGEVWTAASFYEDLAVGSLEKAEITGRIEDHFGVQCTAKAARFILRGDAERL
jgi:acyl carrier protein